MRFMQPIWTSLYLEEPVLAMLNQFLFPSGKQVKADRKQSFQGGHDQAGRSVFALRGLVLVLFNLLFLEENGFIE